MRTDPFKVERVLFDGRPALRELLRPHHKVSQEAHLAYEAELRDLAHLRLPGLPALYETTRTADGELVAVYEAPEPSLASRLSAGPLSHQDVVQLGRDLCGVLTALRAAGHVATCLAPSHVAGGGRRFFLSSPAPRGRERLLALAQGGGALPRAGSPEAVRSIEAARYLPVEALENLLLGATPEAEVQALGLLLWRALSGLVPWGDQPRTLEIFRARLAGVPPGPPLPRGRLADLIARCLATDPAQRPASVREVEQGLAE